MTADDYLVMDRTEWAGLRANTPLTLSEEDLATLRGVNEDISLEDVANVYLPLSRLISLHVGAARHLAGIKDTFLGRASPRGPYIIAIAGSVAVGKSTFARVLQALMARWPDHPNVALVTTDGFLYPNSKLVADGIMHRKGFPESYDRRQMVKFLADVKAGEGEVQAPIYSHISYDIVPGEHQTVDRPDILIFEGLNVLQTDGTDEPKPSTIVSDFFDFSIYLDADEQDIEQWYVDRFLLLQKTAFRARGAYFRKLADLTPEEAPEAARQIWRDINRVNLLENILPTRERADLVVRKTRDHSVGEIWLR
ncbi:type I pantothenate kinase [Pseudomonas gingeri]|uniref:Pantothenate kinase n=1 Tax=Pseudomonas gingeri TaxID=117681 RepID=A0A7Y7YIM1_9PSED|nr:type I pantothenate kinase [Pseudomonas gingeri]NWA00759.1 type I pantothenate kinase [Pseudomonas gingeri]NWA16197.1 type I pantothenate kinase [Pseudomonas gingeri]NWA54387.1 type I pantothenate kinase [Pseudomonas gingeri]NWA97536.1 type I pantothenate kinase [Pseudomonas gingeri]NWB04342.1 type I pantothenate kinase [Pseudomonas gingeri]